MSKIREIWGVTTVLSKSIFRRMDTVNGCKVFLNVIEIRLQLEQLERLRSENTSPPHDYPYF